MVMIVSWNWLKDFVPLTMSPEEIVSRLTMSGLNHESTEHVGDDLAIDLEVTSNRSDCLGHIGVAREISVLCGQPLTISEPELTAGGPPVATLTSVTVEVPQLCPRYTARVLRGVRIGPSPKWLADRLTTLGIGVINNVVDVTNYVMMECGQPLHAFDLGRLTEGRIVVREARAQETLAAIDHRTYPLQPGMCVIADAIRPVAIAGVMGGAETEVTERTQDLLIEAADFSPLSVRATARGLRLHSPSSYRFERRVDQHGIDWASRRACQMILQLAGGTLAAGVVDVTATPPQPHPPVTLRLSQIKRILGIEIPTDTIRKILTALGNQEQHSSASELVTVPPTWRRDLSREVDLIEEVARVHGYDKIPEDVGVPMASSHTTDQERVLDMARDTLVASGFFEALTPSLVELELAEDFSPSSAAPCLKVGLAMLRGADHLRKSLVPSLLRVAQLNESLGNRHLDFFETARVYLPRPGDLPNERYMVGLVSRRPFGYLKGLIETLVERLRHGQSVEVRLWQHPYLAQGTGVELWLNGEPFGYLGVLSAQAQKKADIRQEMVVAELNFESLVHAAVLVPQFSPVSMYPSVQYDLNLIVDEKVRWGNLADTVRSVTGDMLEQLEYCETYRDYQKDGHGRKRLLFSLRLRSLTRTLTGDEADQIRRSVLAACEQHHGAQLLA